MLPYEDQLQIISNCPICNSQNFPAQIRVLQERENAHLLHIRCRKCHSCLLVLVTFSPQGLASMGLLTDLNSDEVIRFSQGKPVSTADVLELYEQVRTEPLALFNQESLDKADLIL